MKINDVKDVYHIHLWNISEHNVAMECHVVSDDETVAQKIARKMNGWRLKPDYLETLVLHRDNANLILDGVLIPHNLLH